MRPGRPRWFRRHPRAAFLGGAVLVFVVIGLARPESPSPTATAGAPAVTASPTPSSSPSPSPTPSASAKPTASLSPSPTTSTPSPSPSAAPSAGTALAAVDLLEVKGRAPRTGYDRDLFGSGWVDVDRNGCDTRNDMLARDLTDVTTKPGTRGCVVLTGTLGDPYSGRTIAFQRGNATSTAVQIDHVVALSDAWQKGAQQWDDVTRTTFANDPLNLLAVDGPLNQQKGDGDTATWLPPNKAFRCTYVARQVAVKVRYAVWVTAAERDAMVRVLSTCPEEPLPGDGTVAVVVPGSGTAAPAPADPPSAPAPAPDPAPAPAPPAEFAPAPATDPQFSSCKAAKASGYGPYTAGVDPEYGWYRDGDSDGIVCE